jgi:hypothetical protein
LFVFNPFKQQGNLLSRFYNPNPNPLTEEMKERINVYLKDQLDFLHYEFNISTELVDEDGKKKWDGNQFKSVNRKNWYLQIK